jgi:replication factor A1
MAIKDLQPKQGFEVVEGAVVEKAEIREFQKFGKPGRVCSATIKDETGQCSLSLWNEQIETVNVGDVVRVTDGYANEWQGNIQVSAGRNGKIEKIGEVPADKQAQESSEEPVEEKKTPEAAGTVDPNVVEEDITE